MLPLDSPRWAELDHAYGKADDIPALLRQCESFPPDDGRSGPWFSIWSALAHQGDVYSASFAAVPHIIGILGTNPIKAGYSFICFPAWVEICRHRRSVKMTPDVEGAYFNALSRLPSLAVAGLQVERDEGYIRCAMSAIAAANNQHALAAAVLDLSPDVVDEFMEWYENR